MLTARTRRGEAVRHDRLTAMHHAHYADLIRYFARRGAVNDADELAAEVFVIAWKKLPDGLENARPWLFGVARKVLGNARRTHHRHQSLNVPLTHDDDTERTPPVTTHSAPIAFRIDLQRAWNQLTAADQEILALTAWDGLTAAEAATALNISRSSASMRLARARGRLRTLINAAQPAAQETP